ncbi:MAG: NAD(P)H-dependent oxidoreductase [Candidatus Omnitrophica bacterium]|nr:NAD(P)H-dependent oxidoreductase [Candidatus Omnitrophota bacterium]
MINDLNWRYATKKFDYSKKVSKQDLEDLLEVLRLSPSSFGLQPWKFIVVKNEALRQEIRKNSWDQPQVTDASDLIVLCSLKTMDRDVVKKFINTIAETWKVSPESLAGYEQKMLGSIKAKSPEEISNWMKRQVYIALGMLLSACAQKKIDACPMEGFIPKKVDEILGLEAQGLESVVMCPIGYRASDDSYAVLKKVRLDKSKVLIER